MRHPLVTIIRTASTLIQWVIRTTRGWILTQSVACPCWCTAAIDSPALRVPPALVGPLAQPLRPRSLRGSGGCRKPDRQPAHCGRITRMPHLVLKLGTLLAAALFLVHVVVAARERPPAPHPFWDGPSPRVIAHRGGRGLWPENTLYAFRRAAAARCWLSLDRRQRRNSPLPRPGRDRTYGAGSLPGLAQGAYEPRAQGPRRSTVGAAVRTHPRARHAATGRDRFGRPGSDGRLPCRLSGSGNRRDEGRGR